VVNPPQPRGDSWDRDHLAVLGRAGADPRRPGPAVPLHLARWSDAESAAILIDLIEEYARHVGHADLVRESVDGLVGEDPPY
jgi:hypothetical protein